MPAPERADLLAQINAAQADLNNAISQLSRDAGGDMLAQAEAQREMLALLERNILGGGTMLLATIRGEVAAAVSASANLGQQARGSSDPRVGAAELAAISAVSRQQVQSLMRDMHRFDPYLRFDTREEEAAYRRREAERREYIEEQHRRGTPQSDLNAAGAAIAQMEDAGANGARNSPEFQRRWDELVGTTGRLRDQVQRSGESTRDFDDAMQAALRRAMQMRGLTNSEINTRLTAHSGNPLDALQSNRESSEAGAVAPSRAAPTAPVQNIADAMAEFRAAGIVTLEQAADARLAHGLTVGGRPAPPGPATRI